MAESRGTPVKKAQCFACLDVKPWRLHLVGSAKWEKECMDEKLRRLCGDDTVNKLEFKGKIGACYSCFLKIKSTYDFVISVVNGVQRLSQCKREAKTPGDGQASLEKKKTKRQRRRRTRSLLTSTPSKPRRALQWPADISSIVSEKEDDSFLEITPLPLLTSEPSVDFTKSSLLDTTKLVSIDTTESTLHFSVGDHAYATSVKEVDNDVSANIGTMPHDSILAKRGLSNETYYALGYFTDSDKKKMIQLTENGSIENMLNLVMQIPTFVRGLQRKFLEDVQAETTLLSSMSKPSLLRSVGSMDSLQQGTLAIQIVQEMESRCPFLLDVLVTVATPQFSSPASRHIGPVSLAYSMLMFIRNKQLSAFQRLLTIIFTKGSMNEQCLMTCNKLGISLSPTSKLNLLDECCTEVQKKITKQMQSCCLCNLVGDNCDIRITPNHQATDHQVKDCHYFAVLLVFSRMAYELSQIDTHKPTIIPNNIPIETMLLSPGERLTLLASYKIILGRLMAKNLKSFRWLLDILPKHIPHQYSEVMARKSHILPLQIILKNEAKYEDCVAILDQTVALLHIQQNEQDQAPNQEVAKLPFIGDQLTRVRLQGAKALRRMAPNPASRFDNIGPFLCAWWHIKQDFLHVSKHVLTH